MLIPEVFIFEPLVKKFAIVADVFRVVDLDDIPGLAGTLVSLDVLEGLALVDLYLCDFSAFGLYPVLDKLDYLGFEVFEIRVEVLIAHLLAQFGHHVDGCCSDLAVPILKILLAEINQVIHFYTYLVLLDYSGKHVQFACGYLGHLLARVAQ